MNSAIQHLLQTVVDSVEQCEMIVSLCNGRHRWWTAKELEAESYLGGSPTARDLEVLATRGLLEVRLGNDVHYRFAPASPELERSVTALAEMYRTHRVDVLSYIIRRRGRAIQHFAEAFDFRGGH